jgi:hypothetical protein
MFHRLLLPHACDHLGLMRTAKYRVPSPNFVCCCPMVDRYSEHDVETIEGDGCAFVSSVGSDKVLPLIPASVEFDSASSSTPTNDASSDLLCQLELARKEIEQLKFQIAHNNAGQV